MIIEVNVTKPIPHSITVMDPNGRMFKQDVVMEWKPLYCEKCQKIGHQCQTTAKVEQPKKSRPGKKVTQTWQYKGPIQQHEKIVETRQILETKEDEVSLEQEEKQGSEQRSGQEIKETPEKNLRHYNGGKQLEFSMSNFPLLSAIPLRNGFKSLKNSKLVSLPVDRGGTSKSC